MKAVRREPSGIATVRSKGTYRTACAVPLSLPNGDIQLLLVISRTALSSGYHPSRLQIKAARREPSGIATVRSMGTYRTAYAVPLLLLLLPNDDMQLLVVISRNALASGYRPSRLQIKAARREPSGYDAVRSKGT